MKKTSFDVQKEQSVSFMYFNRFLMLRYFTAFMFFTNLYWFGMALALKSWSAIIPLFLMIGGIAVTMELTSKLHLNTSQSDQQILLSHSTFGQSCSHLDFNDVDIFFVFAVSERQRSTLHHRNCLDRNFDVRHGAFKNQKNCQ